MEQHVNALDDVLNDCVKIGIDNSAFGMKYKSRS
jgi:hypothetical protein